MYAWAKADCKDPLVMADILFFVHHTPGWCYKWTGTEQSKEFVDSIKFTELEKKIDNLS